MPTKQWTLSSGTHITWRSGRIQIACPASDVLFRSDDPDVVLVLHEFAQPSTIEEVQRRLSGIAAADIVRCVEVLIEAKVLVDECRADRDDDTVWDSISLAFHRITRAWGRQDTADGPNMASVGEAQPLIELPSPARRELRSLPDLLHSRRSARSWPARSIPFQDFADFLDLSLRNHTGPLEVPHEVRRAYPSGGGLYSLTCYPMLAASAVDGLRAGAYRYEPDVHALKRLVCDEELCAPFLLAAASSARGPTPPIVIVITSRFAAPSKVYGALAYSLILKEVGAVFQTFYLVAAHLGLAACALGGGAPDALFARMTGVLASDEPIVGEFMLGPR